MSARPGDLIIVESKGLTFLIAHQTILCVLYFMVGLFSRPWIEELFRRYLG